MSTRHSVIVAGDGDAAAAEIDRLFTQQVLPAITRTLATRRLTPDERAEVASVVSLRLIRRLHAAQRHEHCAVADVRKFVLVATLNAIVDLRRRRNPPRVRARRKLRITLDRCDSFATWTIRHVPVIGMAEWKGRRDFAHVDELSRIGDPSAIVRSVLLEASAPVPLEDLVALFAAHREPAAEMPLAPCAAEHFEIKERLRIVWSEIRLLPLRQRVALLFNLRDPSGSDLLALLVQTSIATVDDLAAAMGLSVAELESIATSLPMDDMTLAGRLGVTRQQVINLRKAAKKRLVRRVARRSKGKR